MSLKRVTFLQAYLLTLALGFSIGCSRNLRIVSPRSEEPLASSLTVVSATSTFLRPNSERLFIYDRIYPADTVELVNGHLISTDNRGGYFEFEGDTIFQVSEIIKKMPEIGYRTNSGGSIDKLYITSEPFLLKAIGAIEDGPRNQGIKFIFPPSSSANYSFNQLVCLKWASTDGERIDSGNFQVEIKSIFDEVIGNFQVVGGEFEFDPKNYEERLVIIEVHGLEDQQILTKPLGLRFYGNMTPYATPCHANTALEHFCLGLTYESNQLIPEAGKHYELATALSAQPFYQRMLENFKKRNKIN